MLVLAPNHTGKLCTAMDRSCSINNCLCFLFLRGLTNWKCDSNMSDPLTARVSYDVNNFSDLGNGEYNVIDINNGHSYKNQMQLIKNSS